MEPGRRRLDPVGELSDARDHLAAASDGEGCVWFLGGRLGSLDSNRATVDLVDGDEVMAAAGDLTEPRGGVAAFHAPGLGACLAGGVAYTLLGGPEPGLAVSDVIEALPLG